MTPEKITGYDDSEDKRHSRFVEGIRQQIYVYGNLRAYFSSQPRIKFVIFAQGRSGGTLLDSLLNTHPECVCAGEILYWPVFFPHQFLEHKSRIASKRCFGFRVKIYQLAGIQRRSPRKFLERMMRRGWRLIYLKRENIFLQAISNLVAENRSIYHDFGDRRHDPFYVPPARLLSYMEKRLEYLEQEEKALEGMSLLSLNYEEDLMSSENHQNTATRIFSYLGITDVKVQTRFVKSVPQDLRSVFINYEELIQQVRNSPFKKYVVDGS